MKRLVPALLAALLVAALLPAPAQAAFYNSRYTSADAWWSSWDWMNGTEPGPEDATEDWNVSGFTGTGVFKDAGFALERDKTSMGIAMGMTYAPADGPLPRTWTEFTCMAEPPSVLMFGKALGTAELEFLAEGTLSIWRGDEPWREVAPGEWEMRSPDATVTEMVSVMAEWNGIGPISRSAYTMRDRSAGNMWADRSLQTYRRATADASIVGASGRVYLAPGADFAVEDAQISESKSNGRFSGTPME